MSFFPLIIFFLSLLSVCASTSLTILHLSTDPILDAITVPNKQSYASRHDYIFLSSTRCPDTNISCLLHSTDNICTTTSTTWVLATTSTILFTSSNTPFLSHFFNHTTDPSSNMFYTTDWNGIIPNIVLTKCNKDGIALAATGSIHGAERVSKQLLAVYVEEFQPGDLVLSLEQKSKEIEHEGLLALAKQYDILANIEDLDDVKAWFSTQYLLNRFSGICVREDEEGRDGDCDSIDERRLRLEEPIGWMSRPRYRHLKMRGIEWTDGEGGGEEEKDEL